MIKLITNSEEFAYNTNTTTTDNTTSFGYGPGGVLFGTYHTGADGFITKRVSFHSPVLPTDIITIEYSANGTNWATIPTTFFAPTSQGNSRYGIAMSTVVGSNFCDVLFGAKGIHATGTTFGAVGENYITTHYWRVRKSSSAVAQPVSAIYNQPNSWTASNDFTTFKIKNSTFLTTIAGSATADRIITLPNASGTMPLLSTSNSWTASNDFTTFKIKNNTFLTTIAGSATANRTITLPDASGTVVLKEVDNNFNAKQTFGNSLSYSNTETTFYASNDSSRLVIGGGSAGSTSNGPLLIMTGNSYSSGGGNATLSSATRINFNIGGSTIFSIVTPNIVSSPGIYANTTASAANVFVASNGDIARSTSALKYKDDVQDIEESSWIHGIKPITYISKCEHDDKSKRHFGIIADHVDALCEDGKMLVSYEILEDGAKQVEGFQYERLTVLLLAELQKLRKDVDELKAQLST